MPDSMVLAISYICLIALRSFVNLVTSENTPTTTSPCLRLTANRCIAAAAALAVLPVGIDNLHECGLPWLGQPWLGKPMRAIPAEGVVGLREMPG